MRRKFDEAIKALPTDVQVNTSKAAQGLEYCNRLFSVEREADEREYDYEQRKSLRLEKAAPIFDEFISWAQMEAAHALPKSKLRDALNYVINQQNSLRNYMLDGKIEISNNRAERSIKPFVIGRKNWLFSNTPKGADASAVIYSIMETAKECSLNPFEYFRYLFEKLPEEDLTVPENLEKYLPYSKSIPDWCRQPEISKED